MEQIGGTAAFAALLLMAAAAKGELQDWSQCNLMMPVKIQEIGIQWFPGQARPSLSWFLLKTTTAGALTYK